MHLIPEEEMGRQRVLNLAPMVDFLFLIIAALAVLAITRTALYDSEVSLVKMDVNSSTTAVSSYPAASTILLSINDQGKYKWVTESDEFIFDQVSAIKNELLRQQKDGLLSKENTKVLLYIDQNAKWQSIATIILAVKELGFQISPVYSPEQK